MKHLRIQKKKCIQLLSLFLSFLLLISSFTFNVSAENLWSDQYVKTLIENGVFDDSDYSYDSKRTITYDEFIEMAAKLFHYDKAAQMQEITLKNWFTKNITDIGQEKELGKLLTRQDAVVMLAKMLKYSGSSKSSKFTDDELISDYARESINAFTEKGYLNGYLDGTFRPNNSLSQGEAAKLICMASGTVYSKKGVYDLKDKVIRGTLSVVSPDITIKNAVIEGDLYISEGVGTGEVKLENVTVKGETIVSGGGMNSVVFIDTKLGTLRVETPDNVPVRIVASGDTNINMTQVHSEGKLQTDNLKGDGFKGIVIAIPADARVSLDGKFPSVTVDSPKAKVDILGGKADNIIVSKNAEEAKINVASKAVVGSMEINAKSTIGGTGKLDKVSIASENVSIAQKPSTVEVGKDIKTNINNKTLSTGVYNNTSRKSSSSSSKIKNSRAGKVILESGSEGTAGNACITGLEIEQRYYIIVYKDKKSYPVMKDGKLGTAGLIAYDNLEPLETDTIKNLTNYEKYKVIKVLEPKKEALLYSYKEIEHGNESLFVEMFFDEPVEFLVNKQNVSDDVLKSSFVYSSESESGKVESVSLSSDKKSILFVVPKKGSSYQISLSDEAKKDSWRLKNIGKDNEYKQMIDVFLEFKLIDSEFTVNGPDNVTVFAGEKAVFQANIESNSELKYQWYRDGKAISDAVGSTYSLTTGLNDNESKFSVKVWAETSDNTIEFIMSKTAFLTVKSKEDEKVILEDGSEGTAGNACITGLEIGQKYYIISYKDNKKYSVMKNGTLGGEITEVVYDDLEILEIDTISNLTNEEKYKVVKVLEPAREALLYSYKEIERGNESLFVEMFFDEPVEFLVNKQNISDDILKNSFVYSNGSESEKIEEVSLSEDKKSILFVVPKKGSSYQISLNDEAKKDNWRLKSVGKDNEYKQMMDIFLEFTIMDSSFTVSEPEDQTIFAGREAKFEVKAQSEYSSNFSYQWYKDGEIIEDATQSAYSFIAALSDSESKYSAKVWRTTSDNTREFVMSGSALLTVEIPEVLLTESSDPSDPYPTSEGEAGDGCVTGLEIGSRYFIIAVNENKSYPIMKDGTLGPESIDLIYANLEPLETTVITGLKNKELYCVRKVLPSEEMPLLQELRISGLTTNINFLGYVSPTINDAEIPLSQNNLKLKLKPMKESAEISVSYTIGGDLKQDYSLYPDENGYYNCDIYLGNFVSEDVKINIIVSEENSAKPMTYTIVASRAAGIIVTEDLWNNYEYDYFVSRRAFELEYYIKYMKSTETFDGITYKKIQIDLDTGNEIESDSITLVEDTDYTKETLDNKAIQIKMTKNFYEKLVVGDKLEFTFKFSSNATPEKVCKAEIYQGTPKYNLQFGEPMIIDPNEEASEEKPEVYVDWLNIFVPVNKESGEAIENLKDIGSCIDYVNTVLYNNDNYSYSYGTGYTEFEYKGQKGILLRQGLPSPFSLFDSKAVPNKYGIEIHYYKISETNEITTESYNFDLNKFDIPVGKEVKGNVEFSCTSGAAIEVTPKPEGTSNEFVVTLTKENKPLDYNFKWEDESENDKDSKTRFYEWSTLFDIIWEDDGNGNSIPTYIKAENDRPELGYIAANMNSIPKLFLYDYEGDIVDERPVINYNCITNYDFYISSYNDLGYYFYSYFYAGNERIYTVKDLKDKHLQPKNITLTIGTKKDGTPVSKTMQDFLDADYFGKENGDEDYRSIDYLYFNSIRELFAAFDFNPSEDTLSQEVTLSAKLDEGTDYELKDNYTNNFYESNSFIKEIIIKDKNSNAKISLKDFDTEEIKDIEVPYTEAAIITYTSNGDCTVFDEDGVIVTSNKGLILTENESRRFSIVAANGGELPKIYKFDITYKPESADNLSLASITESDNKANVSFINITEDMLEEEIENILKSVENEKEINIDTISNDTDEISQESNKNQENEAIDTSETEISDDSEIRESADKIETSISDNSETKESTDKIETSDILETEESIDETETSNEPNENQQAETENLIKSEDETLEESAENSENEITENLDDESVDEPEEIDEQDEQ